MTVRFENTSPIGTGLISVDNVSVTPVPEPAEYAAAAGAALVAFGLFRRRNR
jgi:MYXO-CTERM domain-containing protein